MHITEFLEARIADDEARAGLIADTSSTQNHMAQWDSARVLAECAAKRTILALHSGLAYTDEDPRFPIEPPTCLCKGHPCLTLRALATIYADHPDYLKEWTRGHDLVAAYGLMTR